MADGQRIEEKLEQMERKIRDGEALLRGTRRANSAGRFLIVIGLLLTLLLENLFDIGLLVIAGSTWSLFTTAKHRKELEGGLREYRRRKAELQAELMERE